MDRYNGKGSAQANGGAREESTGRSPRVGGTQGAYRNGSEVADCDGAAGAAVRATFGLENFRCRLEYRQMLDTDVFVEAGCSQ